MINWKGVDYAPTVSADGKTLFFVSDKPGSRSLENGGTVSYTHLRAHETVLDLVCRLLLEKKKKTHIASSRVFKYHNTTTKNICK